jgi:hypothetical protein
MPNLPYWCRLLLQGPRPQHYLHKTNTTVAVKQIILRELMIITFIIECNCPIDNIQAQ